MQTAELKVELRNTFIYYYSFTGLGNNVFVLTTNGRNIKKRKKHGKTSMLKTVSGN